MPRARRRVSLPPGSAYAEERWLGANEAKAERLRGRSLQRRACAQGLTLRHSAYGYALIDPARKRIDDRSNLTLDEVESCLERG
jgi:hypothetical protein